MLKYDQTTYKRLYHNGHWTYCHGAVTRRRCHGVCHKHGLKTEKTNNDDSRFADLLRRGNVGRMRNTFAFLQNQLRGGLNKHNSLNIGGNNYLNAFYYNSGYRPQRSCCRQTDKEYRYQLVNFRCGSYDRVGYIKDYVVTEEPTKCSCKRW